jgi:hypothetical protein
MTANQGPRPLPVPTTIVLAIDGRIARADIPALCERVHVLLDAVTVDALARLQLTAGRLGRRIRLRDPCGELQDLLALMGLGDVLLGAASELQPGGQAEEREQAGGVQEEADPVDPAG